MAAQILLGLLLLLLLPADVGATNATSMSPEQVVRMHVEGRSEEEILAEIESRSPDFDLSPDMLEELRRAGLAKSVIEAMVARQREHDRSAPVTEIDAESVPLTIRLNPRREGRDTSISVRGRIDPQLAAELELGNAPEDRVFAGIALYLACLTADHVPDQWRSLSPLSVDEITPIPRHRLLVFLTSPAKSEVDPGGRPRLELPERIESPVEPNVEHDLMLGIAVEIGGQYYRWRHDHWFDVVAGDEGLELPATVKGRAFQGPNKLKVSFDRPGKKDDELPSPVHSSCNDTSLLTPGSSIVTP